MKGILRKIENKWMVQYIGHPIDVLGGNDSLVNYLQLHPDDVKQIEEDALVFDDIESRIRAYPHVDFKIIEGYKNYAKLINKDVTDGVSTGVDCCTPKGQIRRYHNCHGCDRKPNPTSSEVDELANKELINHLIDEFGEFKTTTIGADDKKSWWKKGYEKAKETFYTEEQMKLAFDYGKSLDPFDSFEDFIKSLKETK